MKETTTEEVKATTRTTSKTIAAVMWYSGMAISLGTSLYVFRDVPRIFCEMYLRDPWSMAPGLAWMVAAALMIGSVLIYLRSER